MPDRIERMLALASAQGADAVAIMPGANMVYLTGLSFHLMERPTVMFFPVQGAPAFVLPAFESGKPAAGPVWLDWRLYPWTDEAGPEGAFRTAAQELGLAHKTLAVEELRMRVRELRLIQEYAPGVRLVDAGPILSTLRMRKDESELERMRGAVRIAESALEQTLAQVRPGMTEREITSLLLVALLGSGADGLAFEPIVLTGPNTGTPHGGPGDRVLERGDLLLLDFGAQYRGYMSDITRTFAVGEPGDEVGRMYDAVKRANEAGRRAARPGVAIQEVDRAARSVIAAAGYGQYFTHRTGHGLGMDEHEPPYAREGETLVLEPGMTFTVEPGVYVPGIGGVRIEDNVAITPDGCESLTSFDRELRVLG